ncbi:HEAT repeat domain-containing protein [Herbaspirillum sp. ST 5-3]|uniref:HEAT repeat domain-containing protein n=1 Tax=Oxalobacteraceae TaxID=75682 RepID=UPI0010A42F4A|nr:HEAT repeat domain-containing protein [Herbaspirillum sp. ST 5-3]
MNEVFCMHCFALLPAQTIICPVCNRAAEDTDVGDYREKLVNALHHPLAEVRMRAIIALGLRHDKPAADALVACALRNPVDVVEGLQIIDALKILDDGKPRMMALHYLFVRHPASAVKQAALAAINNVLPRDAEEWSNQ